MSTIDNNAMFENIFESQKDYGGGYQPILIREFTQKEIEDTISATVVPSRYGMSVCFFMRSGYKKYIPVARDCACTVGTKVNLATSKLVILQKDDDIIPRIDVM